ncbi:DUF6531 domain-containing protein [Sorangium sp. So ce362]|uniref:DUF6531 domain-containing protein n=1 Tax=Sorangium sp. So ce362 TaxID=3133303 RepID=UPI003F5DFB04
MGKATVGGKPGKNIAHKGSSHTAVGTPATSTVPPPPPTGPAMAPFPMACRSAKSKDAKKKLKTSKKKTVTSGCSAPVEMPGNQPSKPAVPPHDVVTMKVNSTGTNTTGSSKVKADKNGVAATMDGEAMNVTTEGGKMAQSNGVYTDAVDGGKYNDEWEELSAELLKLGDPVSVATGEVVDERVDLELPGAFPFFFTRLYISSFHRRATPLGRGGWTHNFHQWIEAESHREKGERLVLHDEDGRNVGFPIVTRPGSAFHRAKRLQLTAMGGGAYQVYSLDTHLTRSFAPSAPGGRSLLRAIEDGWGNRVELVYDGERLVKMFDTARREIALTHDTRGRILLVEVRVDGSVLQAVTYAYTDEGDLAAAANALGHSERYAYDGHHRMIEKTLGDGVCVHYDYDPDSGRCRRTWVDGGSHAVEFVYDLAARTTTTLGTLEPRVYTWNKQGAIVKEETFDGAFVRERVYDGDLYLLSEKNAAGDEELYAYDELGNLVKQVDAAGNVIVFEYEEDRHVRTVEPGGRTIAFSYNVRGEVASITRSTGARYELAYDGHGRLAAASTAEGVFLRAEYDDHHNIVKSTDAHGATWTLAYDALGRVVAETDPLGTKMRFEYDAVGQPVLFIHPDGSFAEMAYDARGNLVRYTDPLGQTTTMEFANVRSLVKLTDPLGRAWDFFYDRNGRLRAIKNPRAETFEYRYDRAGRVVEEKTFDGRTLSYQYSKAGRLSRIEYPDGTWRELHYDAAGSLIGDVSPHGSITLERDAIGQVVAGVVEDATGKVALRREWDEHGRLIAETQGEETIRHEYDAFDRRVARILPDGRTTRYYYDANGQLVALDHEGRKLLFQRDALRREVRRYSYRGELDLCSAYDPLGRLTDRWVTALGDKARPLLSRHHWTYDPLDRILTATDLRWGAARFAHDAIGMLIEAHGNASRESFTYDAADSLSASKRERPGACATSEGTPWKLRPGNVLVRDDRYAYEYDENRRRRRRIGLGSLTNEVTEYYWDAHDRLREVTLPDGGRVVFAYDAFGRRVRKEVYPPAVPLDVPTPPEPEMGTHPASQALPPYSRLAGSPHLRLPAHVPSRVVRYLWDGNTLAAEIDSERGTRVYLFDKCTLAPVLHEEQGAVFLYVNDHNETPKELIGEDGRVAWSAAHSAWGDLVGVFCDPKACWARPVETPIRFLGQYADEETGLCCTLFRYFDPAVGRWLSSDPLGSDGGLNLFGFNGSPVLDRDPFGLEVQHGQIGTMRSLEAASTPHDGLQHHELLNASWLQNNWSRYDGRQGANGGENPAIALTANQQAGDHQDIGRMQSAAGMSGKNAKNVFAKQTARQNMHLNAQFLYKALRKNGMSKAAAKKKVAELYKKTIEFIKKNKLTC